MKFNFDKKRIETNIRQLFSFSVVKITVSDSFGSLQAAFSNGVAVFDNMFRACDEVLGSAVVKIFKHFIFTGCLRVEKMQLVFAIQNSNVRINCW